MLDRVYLERGKPVRVLIKWGPGGGPRNVLIQREDGSKTVRPFRGLRRAAKIDLEFIEGGEWIFPPGSAFPASRRLCP